METIESPAFAELLRNHATRWIDVRAPVEFALGAVPGAVNLPLLTNEERHRVGIAYKQKGRQAALELGHQLVSGPVKEARIEGWIGEIRRHPGSVVYCFRGGLRSQTVQGWLKERGVEVPVIAGGYKALRRFLLATLESRARELRFLVVAGPTGTGKTAFLRSQSRPALDLELLARHRGSAFGALAEPQPSQADFENSLALALLRLPGDVAEVLIEDESRMIGQLAVPEPLFAPMRNAPRLRLEVPLDQRVENIFREYVVEPSLGSSGATARFAELRRSVEKISRRLGGQLAKEILQDISGAEQEFLAGGGLGANRAWIRKLLVQYYDPFYQRWQLAGEKPKTGRSPAKKEKKE